eukprot:TRINITY_DN238_c0_g1_i1.p1 TRINITY_DN238_c0_g1~~TRINITY_DN238_c0_g1_i1.p1  ORF type:complete len:250 (-),score=100.06 TRINITY_DN238_c0_g1_i1:123-872(-)
MAKNKNKGSPRNYALASGVMRFSKASMYHKKAIFKFAKKKTAKAVAQKKAVFVEKKIKGDKNGGTRMVRVKKLANNYPTAAKAPRCKTASAFKSHARKLRSSLKPGVVAILLGGVHKGKHVVVLKQLASGLLLVTGPMAINGCPMRRINQNFVIATQTSIDISNVKIPDTINDEYFARAKATKTKKEGEIFEAKKEVYAPSEQKKKDQAELDKQIVAAVKAHSEGALLRQYLKTKFGLTKGQYPHNMVF